METCGSRNGDDSPVGIESVSFAKDLFTPPFVEMEMTARLGLKDATAERSNVCPGRSRNGDDSPVGIERLDVNPAPRRRSASKWR